VSRIALLVIALAACGGGEHPRDSWMSARGAAGPTWGACVRVASAMRAECGADAACGDRVTRDYSYDCYWARYRADRGDDRPEALSPCFLSDDTTVPADLPRRCRSYGVPAAQTNACVAELSYIIKNDCAGNVDLTGAGP
jgi:hypothetical protein